MDHDLSAERDSLEREIAALERTLEIASARLDVARNVGVRPRGLAAGAMIGVLVTAAFLFVGFLTLMTSIGRLD